MIHLTARPLKRCKTKANLCDAMDKPRRWAVGSVSNCDPRCVECVRCRALLRIASGIVFWGLSMQRVAHRGA